MLNITKYTVQHPDVVWAISQNVWRKTVFTVAASPKSYIFRLIVTLAYVIFYFDQNFLTVAKIVLKRIISRVVYVTALK